MKHNAESRELALVELRCGTCGACRRITPDHRYSSDPEEDTPWDLIDELVFAVEGYRIAWYCRHCRKTTEHELVRLPRSAAAKQPASRRAR